MKVRVVEVRHLMSSDDYEVTLAESTWWRLEPTIRVYVGNSTVFYDTSRGRPYRRASRFVEGYLSDVLETHKLNPDWP